MLNNSITKAKYEKQVFKAFSKIAPITILPGSIESKDPPMPDILCEIEGEGQISFELTSLIDENIMSHLSPGIDLNNLFFDKKYNIIDTNIYNSFIEKFEDTRITINFSKNTNRKQKVKGLKILIEELVIFSDKIEGEVLKNNAKLLPIIEWVFIYRNNPKDVKKPILEPNIGSICMENPISKNLAKKFNKKYKCEFPI
jgi:hypothetical protein